MHSDVESLLALQIEDQAIGEMEARLAALEPRLREMDVAHTAAVEALDRARRAVEAEEGGHRELQTRIAQHKQLHERNIAQLDSVRRMKEATAAMSQVEQARRILAEEEGALQGISRRLTELRGAVETHERTLAELEGEHRAERETIGEARAEVDGQLASRRTTRAAIGREGRSGAPPEIRSHPHGAARRGDLPASWTVVRALRYECADAAPQRDGGQGHDRGLRDVRRPDVRCHVSA